MFTTRYKGSKVSLDRVDGFPNNEVAIMTLKNNTNNANNAKYELY